MATTENASGNAPDPRKCANAETFVLRRLDGADGPLRPSKLAPEYGCTQAHMRDVMASLCDDGEIHRVGRGRYVSDASVADEYHYQHTDADAGHDGENASSDAQDDAGTHENSTSESAGSNDSEADMAALAGAAGAAPRTLLMVLAVAAVGFVLYRSATASGSTSSTSTAATSDQDRDQDRAVTGGALSEE